ncbi:MAG: protease modulator HflC [Proteobacteria bacterium]|nr:protease modulator HflC [Burkholderiales bacterium]
MKNNPAILIAALLLVLVIFSMSVFVVDQRQSAIVLRLGTIAKVVEEPGLNFKIPLLDTVRFFDRRILTIDAPEPERFQTSEKKNVLVDSFVKWRIVDVRQYFISVQGNEAAAVNRLSQTINSSLRSEFGSRTVNEVISGEREKLVQVMRERADTDARAIGVEVVDVRIKRVDFPQEVSESVYRRMEAERKRVANELRSTGSAEGEKIRADADRQREIILAEAFRDAQRVKGEGDARASATYTSAFQSNGEFFAFYRSLEAYKSSFAGRNNVFVLEPNSEFFRYFRGPGSPAR